MDSEIRYFRNKKQVGKVNLKNTMYIFPMTIATCGKGPSAKPLTVQRTRGLNARNWLDPRQVPADVPGESDSLEGNRIGRTWPVPEPGDLTTWPNQSRRGWWVYSRILYWSVPNSITRSQQMVFGLCCANKFEKRILKTSNLRCAENIKLPYRQCIRFCET